MLAPGLWLGADVELADEVAIGANVVSRTSAGSLIARDVPASNLVTGSPAKPMRQVGDDELLERFRVG